MIGKVLFYACVRGIAALSHPESSARRCAFLLLVLSDPSFHSFRSGADPQVRLQKHRANVNWGGLSHCALAQGLECTHRPTHFCPHPWWWWWWCREGSLILLCLPRLLSAVCHGMTFLSWMNSNRAPLCVRLSCCNRLFTDHNEPYYYATMYNKDLIIYRQSPTKI